MKRLWVLAICSFLSCAVPFTKLSDELGAKHLAYRGGYYYTVETFLENYSGNVLDLRVICDMNGEEKIYNIKIMPKSTLLIKEKILSPFSGLSISCEFGKR